MAPPGNSQNAIPPLSNSGPQDPAMTETGDVLSPTDGYFHTLPPQPETEYVPDPEQVNTAAAKEIEAREAQEARERRQANRRAGNLHTPRSRPRDASPAASSIVSASSGRSVDTTAEQDVGPGPAPRPALPSYDDAIAERPYQGQAGLFSEPRAYSTMGGFDNRPASRPDGSGHGGRDVESAPLLQASGSDGGDDSWRGRWRRKWRTWNKKHGHNSLARKLLVVLIFVCGMAFAIKLIAFLEPQRTRPWYPEHDEDDGPAVTKTPLISARPSMTRSSRPDPTETSALPDPTKTSTPHTPTKPSHPDDPPDLTHGRIEQGAVKFCKSKSVLHTKSSLPWDFGDPDKFEFTQTSNAGFALQSLLRTGGAFDLDTTDYVGDNQPETDKRRRIRHNGQVIIERKEKGSGVSIQVGGYYSHKFLAHQTGFAADGSSILLQVPRNLVGEHEISDDLCIYSFAIIQVAPSHNLSSLRVDAEVMSVSVEDSLDLGAATKSIGLQTRIGSVRFPPPNTDISKIRGRDIYVKTAAGEITGTYPLYDSLTLISTAGAVNVTVDPREADPNNVQPAKLDVETGAGVIKVDTLNLDRFIRSSTKGTRQWPAVRDYRAKISSAAGLVEARLLHGTRTEVQSQAGDIGVFLVPCDDPERESKVIIEAQSSLINLDIANSIRSPRTALRRLGVHVQSTVGSQSIGLPFSWEGKLHGSSIGGSIKTSLTDFVADHDSRSPFLDSVDGHRGEGEGLVESETVTGFIEWTDTRYP